MGFFNRKKTKVDINQVFKDKYKDLNQTVRDANNEVDFQIQLAMLELANKKYDDLLELIDQGADFDQEHFILLQRDLQKQIDLLKGLADEN